MSQQAWESPEAGTEVSASSPAQSLTAATNPRYLRGCVQFEGRLLGHTAEVGPNLLFVTLVVGVVQVVVVSWRWNGSIQLGREPRFASEHTHGTPLGRPGPTAL